MCSLHGVLSAVGAVSALHGAERVRKGCAVPKGCDTRHLSHPILPHPIPIPRVRHTRIAGVPVLVLVLVLVLRLRLRLRMRLRLRLRLILLLVSS